MSTFLFDQIIFGPVWSRRLGESLGINLLPPNRKICNFNCVYCECGLTHQSTEPPRFPEASEVIGLLEKRLITMKQQNDYLNTITFAGNGEPTLHPQFPWIIEKAISLRDSLFPGVSIAVLSNATRVDHKPVFDALLKADLNILKLDSAFPGTIKLINNPSGKLDLPDLLKKLALFNGKVIIQTLFLKGKINGTAIDNTTDEEVTTWLQALQYIKPESVMIYSLARETAVNGLESVEEATLQSIAARCEAAGFKAQVTP
ncbi:MAG: radical SAM protein [Bacteroidales bacterium]|nr:radical SAM protein [Bacteroidales bacterium]